MGRRVAKTTYSGGTRIATYKYDYLGRRVVKTAGGTTIRYTYDGDQIIADYNESGVLQRKYVYGPGIDEPIIMINVSGGNETKYYYHFDGLGSVVALSNSNGGIVEKYSYNVFGEPNRTSSINNPYFFTGRQYDSETGLYYYRARYYKPSIGRFLQQDPIGYEDGMNLYTYVLNNPVNQTDPTGLLVLKCPSTEAGAAKSDGGLCDDGSANLFHSGQHCYREVVPMCTKGQPAGLHCCYKNGKLVNHHMDSISPATGGGGGKCQKSLFRLIKHGIWDVWLIPGSNWVPEIPHPMPILAF